MSASLDRKIRFRLVSKGYVSPAMHNRVDQRPGHAVAVRRVDDRPVTRVVPVTFKSA